MAKLSVIIPSRNELFLPQTVNDIFAKASGDVEVIAILDGYWPDPPLTENPNLILIHRGYPRGMRNAINSAASIASGKYLMKVDGHCMFAEGFDEVLKADMEDNWVVIPRRYSLDAEKWQPRMERTPIDYEFLSYPYWKPEQVGIHGTIWRDRAKERKDILIDDNMSFQGSCWFTTKDHFWGVIGGLQEEGYETFIGEPQEVGMKTWLGGGRLVTNKKTWYAHLHKGKQYGRGYFMSKAERTRGNAYSVNYWMRNLWPERKHDIAWLVEKFWPVPSWPDDRSLWKMQEENFVSIPKSQDVPKEPSISKEITIVENPLDYLAEKYNLNLEQRLPIVIEKGEGNHYGRWFALPEIFTAFGYKVGAEIGVEEGIYSARLCSQIPELKLYCVDPWLAYKGYRDHVSQDKLDKFYEGAKVTLAPYNCKIVKRHSMEAVKDFDDGMLDFVYIDGNHEFKHVTEDIVEWEKKVRVGGIVAGHDFKRQHSKSKYICHVKDVVQAYAYAHGIRPWFVLHGDPAPSWFWIKT